MKFQIRYFVARKYQPLKSISRVVYGKYQVILGEKIELKEFLLCSLCQSIISVVDRSYVHRKVKRIIYA